MPPALASLPAYAAAHWIDPTGRCEPAPWLDPARFVPAASDAAVAALSAGRLAELHVHCRAIEAVGGEPILPSSEVAAAAAVLARPGSAAEGVDPDRGQRLRTALAEDRLAPTPAWRLAVTLVAVRPAEQWFLDDEIEALVHRVGLTGELLAVTRGLLRLRHQAADPVLALRQALDAESGPTPESLAEDLRARQRDLERYYIEWKFGRHLKTDFCKRVWRDIGKAVLEGPLAALLPPTGGRPTAEWDVAAMRGSIGRWWQQHEHLADKAHARHEDRRTMDKAMREMIRLATEVNEARARSGAAAGGVGGRGAAGTTPDEPTLAGAHELLVRGTPAPSAGAGETSADWLCRAVLYAGLRPTSAEGVRSDQLWFAATDVFGRPALLGAVAPGAVRFDPGDAAAVLAAADVEDAPRASAVLARPAEADPPASVSELADRLVASRRPDLLSRLRRPDVADAVRRAVDDQSAATADASDALWAQWVALDALADHPWADQLRAAYRAVRSPPQGHPPPGEDLLCACWLADLTAGAAAAARAHVESLTRQVARVPDQGRRKHLQARLERHEYADVIAALSGGHPHGGGGGGRAQALYRITRWRDEAEQRWPKPAEANLPPGPRAELLRLWLNRHAVHATHDRALLVRLRDELWPALVGSGNDRERSLGVAAQAVRDLIERRNANPCYIPQLALFDRIVIAMREADADDRNFIARHLDAVAARPNDLTVVLAPRLAMQARRDVIRAFRDRRLRAAVIDDVDLLRLLDPPDPAAADPLIGLLELALEQQEWEDSISPFEIPDGQHIKLEMFTGRQDQARALATTHNFSRVFSGRKLGKTALLKSIEHRFDRRTMPGGDTLRVLFVPLVGAEAESAVVNRIADWMHRKLDFPEFEDVAAARDADALRRLRADAEAGPAADRLLRLFERYIARAEASREMLLVVLDEADTFVEAQTADVAAGEKSLSWVMARYVEALSTTAGGLPRVRFIFAGYRVTNTRVGVWGNYKGLLTLTPLPPQEAEALVAGPLAKIGIDCAAQAPSIAFRCGYQPAPILAFGRRLLERVRASARRSPTGPQRRFTVRPADVAETYHDPVVRTEVVRIVEMNFDGDPTARVVFACLLHEFEAAYPERVLVDPVVRVLASVRRIDADTSWLDDPAEAAAAEVERCVNTLVDRQLLVRAVNEGWAADGAGISSGVALAFPHHLSLLYRRDWEHGVRQQIQGLKQVAAHGRPPRSVLPERDLDALSEALSARPADAAVPVRMAIVTSAWPRAVAAAGGGIANRAGVPEAAVL
ncbi:MAG TPA: hypothetical protein VF796_11190, partial [Humisphaera sp.]